MTSVRDIFGLACPKCGKSDLSISVEIWADLCDDGSVECDDNGLEWTDASTCACNVCIHVDTVLAFSIDEHAKEVLP